MKHLYLLVLLLTSSCAFADTKISNLSEATNNQNADILPIVTNTAIDGVTQKIKSINLTVGKAVALATTPNQCNGGNYPLGIDVMGNATNCTPAPPNCTSTACSLNSLTTVAGSAIFTTSGLQTISNKTINSPILTGNISLSALTPNTPLYINGSNFITSGSFSGNTTKVITTTGVLTSGDCAKFDGNGNLIDNGATCGAGGGGSGTVNAGTANQVGYYAASTNTISGTNTLIVNGSNVGVDSLSPGQALDIVGGLRTSQGASFNGNVGISSVTPGQTLDVNGTVRAISFIGSGAALTGISGSISGLTTGNIPKASSSSTIANGDMTDLNGNIGVGSTAPGQALDVKGTIRISSNSILNGNVGIGTSTALNQALTVNGFIATQGTSTPTYFTGVNVGMGSTNPGQQLDIQGTVRTTGFILTGNGAASGNVMVSNNIGIGTWMSPSSIGASGGSGGSGTPGGSNQQVQYNSSGAFAGSNKLIFDGSNFGIGTSTAPTLLTINNGATSEASVNSSGTTILNGALTTGSTGQSNTGYGLVVNSAGQGTSSGGDFVMKNSSGSTMFTLGATSNVVNVYNGLSTVGQGVPPLVATKDLTAQTASISPTNIYTTAAVGGAGMYEVSYVESISRAGASSSTLGGVQVVYTDNDDSTAKTTAAGPTSTANTTATVISGVFVVWAESATAIQIESGYASTGGTTMQYNLHAKVKLLG